MSFNPTKMFLIVAAVVVFSAAGSAAKSLPQELVGLHNFFRATPNVFSGSEPEGDAGFESLQKLGVKTVISVDGVKPEAELAAKYGLRYVHLPFGYDGIPTNRVAELAKAAAVLPGPIYVHCHHGKHRGPAAVSVICQADEGWTKEQAEEFMHEAGTGLEYQGLYRSAREFEALTAAQLATVPTNFPAVAKTSSLVEIMVVVDGIHDHLKLLQRGGWKTPANHADLVPAHEALMLLEQFREMQRAKDAVSRSDDYRARLAKALRAAEALHAELNSNGAATDPAFKSVGASCVGCHRKYRNE